MSTLSEIEKAAEKLSLQQKQELIQFLSAQLRVESELPERWAASHEPGPGLPDSAVGRDAI